MLACWISPRVWRSGSLAGGTWAKGIFSAMVLVDCVVSRTDSQVDGFVAAAQPAPRTQPASSTHPAPPCQSSSDLVWPVFPDHDVNTTNIAPTTTHNPKPEAPTLTALASVRFCLTTACNGETTPNGTAHEPHVPQHTKPIQRNAKTA